jgi:hypothetical protein
VTSTWRTSFANPRPSFWLYNDSIDMGFPLVADILSSRKLARTSTANAYGKRSTGCIEKKPGGLSIPPSRLMLRVISLMSS